MALIYIIFTDSIVMHICVCVCVFIVHLGILGLSKYDEIPRMNGRIDFQDQHLCECVRVCVRTRASV